MSNGFNYTYTCEKCGRDFYSKVDPSGWRHKICNGCSGKTYKDYPVNQTSHYLLFTGGLVGSFCPLRANLGNGAAHLGIGLDIIQTIIIHNAQATTF